MSKKPEGRQLPPLTVETLVNGGAGLARHDGRVIFLPHTAVGDRVVGQVVKKKKHFSEARVIDVLESGPDRRIPPCEVAGECGGCQWQHLDYSAQCHWKEQLFRKTLEHQCDATSEQFLPLVAAPDEWHYRSRVQLKCFNSKNGFVAGFYRPKSRYVVGVDSCHILAQPLNLLMQECRNLFNNTPFADKIPQIDLAIDDCSACAVTVHYIGNDWSSLETLLLQSDLNASLFLQMGTKRSLRLVRGKESLTLRHSESDIALDYSVGSFAQINLVQNQVLVDTVIRFAALKPGRRCIDLYCGMGNFALPLARSGADIIGIEEAAGSIKKAKENAQRTELNNCRFICGDAVEEYVKESTHTPIDLLVLDPPRSGALELMIQIERYLPKKIIYVSCDPQTLARDLKILVNGSYRLVSSQPFDMFPQTYHCESVTILELNC